VNAEEQELARERQRENEERRGAALASVLEPAARERRA
jgi:DNA-binding TFAR19-related protein (PDSD5 family)